MTVVTASGQGTSAIRTFLNGTFQVLDFTSTSFTLSFGATMTVTGTGFTYSTSVINGQTVYQITGGTISGITYKINSTNHTWAVPNVSATTAFNSVLDENAFNSLFFGGDDTFNWSATPSDSSQKFLEGFAGNDTFNLKDIDNYVIDGGSGTDTLNITNGWGGLPNGSIASFLQQFNSPGGTIRARNLETIKVTAGADYTLIADYSNPIVGFGRLVESGNTLTIDASGLGPSNKLIFGVGGWNNTGVLTGNLNLIGGAGDDWFQGGGGTNTFNGGGGSDSVVFHKYKTTLDTAGVTADLGITTPQSLGSPWGTGTFIDIENLYGTPWDDTLIGNASDNLFDLGGGGNDVVDGRGGNDTASFKLVTVLSDPFSPGVTASLAKSGPQQILTGGGQRNVNLISIENLIGSPFADTLTGNSGNNVLDTGGGPVDTLIGGGGFDTAVIAGNRTTYTIAKQVTGRYTATNGGAITTLDGIEAIRFNDGTFAIGGTKIQQSDFDGDRKSDLLLQYTDGSFAVWLTNNMDFLSGGLIGSPGTTWHAKDTGDFDGDGKSDILMQSDDSRIAVWLVDGTGFAGGAQIGAAPGTAWRAISAADIDGDGQTDILLQADDSRIGVWTVNGISFAGGAEIGVAPGTAWKVKGSGDFDGDGKSDMVMQRDTGEIAVWKLNGLSYVLGALVSNPGANWHIKDTGDFDGDGKSDLVMQADDSRVAVWLLDGFGLKQGALVGTPGLAWHVKSASDYNGDGKADIVLQRDTGEIAIWGMNGVSTQSASLTGNPGASWQLLAPAG